MLEITGGNKLIDSVFVLEKAGIREKMQVADLGCGTVGHYVFPAAKMVGKDGRVYAVDILRHVLENIEKRAHLENLENIITVWSDLERYGAARIPSESLDAAFIFNTLFQIKDRPMALKEAVRMLKLGGKLAVVDWLLTSAPLGPPVEGRVDPAWIEVEADKLGLRLIQRFKAGKYHYGLVFEK